MSHPMSRRMWTAVLAATAAFALGAFQGCYAATSAPEPCDASCDASSHCDPENGSCVPNEEGNCTTSADCTAHADGYCAPVANPCCTGWSGFYCVYPGACRTDSDCSGGMRCLPTSGGATECGHPICPL